eukprot:CAMPEP_0181099332 /NCGR_PEP_ID=MMETSP1071-20121207/12604_1 /TAXON_ID=35127 /ORGANISM="Thalassiosira sp., Strain NH16" /LENGTH=216 /DNA_ID=CAMNT_0023181989 /DNA_START=332 /DNA_END=982 /DNA_ORIENTATION=-
MAINATKLVTYVRIEEAIDALLSQVGGPVRAATAAHGDIGQLEPALTLVVPIILVPALQIAHDEIPPRAVVRVVRERLHRLPAPSLLVGNPPVVRRELRKVAYHRLHEVPPRPDGMDAPPRDQDGLVGIDEFVPFLGILDRLIGDVEIAREEVGFQSSVLDLEGLAHRLLVVAIPADVRPRVRRSKISLAEDLVAVETDGVGREVRPRCGRGRHSK